jgi:hypothetical protein
MYADRDFDLQGTLPTNSAALIQDLGLDTLFSAMSVGDEFLFDVAKQAVSTGLDSPQSIVYRQHILADCLQRSAVVRDMYAIAVEAIEREKQIWGWTTVGRYPEGTLRGCIDRLRLFVELLRRLRRIADEQRAMFHSEGFTRLFGMFARELDDGYLATVEEHLRRLAFRHGILMSAELGPGNVGCNYILRNQRITKSGWSEHLHRWIEWLPFGDHSRFVYQVADRDESGFTALSELRSRGVSLVASALAQSTDHMLSFFGMLRLELGFYVGCLNLRDRLARKSEPFCFPEPTAPQAPLLSCRGLYDVCLTLSGEQRVVGNDVRADDKLLVMITGANRGGKTTFLRGVGQAHLLMQCGMFVPAESFRANVCPRLFTHFKREEDIGMRSGKLDEELGRMSVIVDEVAPHSIVLLNESFASTNEREGSEIARHILRALLKAGIKVFYVTHMYDLAQSYYASQPVNALFLLAERLADGRRTFRLVEGEPLPTSYGGDLYRQIFGSETSGTASTVA